MAEAPMIYLAGGGEEGYVDGDLATALFKEISGITVDTVGNIWLIDCGNNCIRKLSVGGSVSTIAGDGTAGFRNGPGSTALFNFGDGSTAGIALDTEGNIIVADEGNHCIRKVTYYGTVSTVAGMAGNEGYRDGPSHSARFFNPTGVAVDCDGSIIVSDSQNNCIRKITREGIVYTLAGTNKTGFRDGQGSLARFSGPTGLAIDMNGNVIVADSGNHSIRKITSSGEVTTLAGNGEPGTHYASLNKPLGLAVDGDNNVIVADNKHSRVMKISQEGMPFETVFERPYNDPAGVAIDSEGNLLVWYIESIYSLYRVAANLEPPQKGTAVPQGVPAEVDTARMVCTHKSRSKYCDVNIHVGNQIFPAHRMVLAQSPFFEACFTEEFCENTDRKVVLKDVSPVAFELVLEYLYTGNWSIPLKCDLLALRSAAEFLMLPQLQNKCESEIQKSLCSDNLAQNLRYAKRNSMNGLKRQCIEFASSSVAELARVMLSKDCAKIFQEDVELSKELLKACEAKGK